MATAVAHRTAGTGLTTPGVVPLHIFEAVISQAAAQRKLIDDLLGLFGGRAQPLMSHLIESGQLTLEDIDEARAALRDATKKE